MKTKPNDFIELQHESAGSGYTGLTKREYFAGLAMQGLCANYLRENVVGWDVKTYAFEAVELADELIKALNEDSK